MDNSVAFDRTTEKFIVKVAMMPKEYGILAQEQLITDLNSVVFDKDAGKFIAPVFMTPVEYGNYV